MRILVINWRGIKNPLAGGAEIYFQEIFRRLVQHGHEVTQLAERFPGSSATEEVDGIRVIRMGGKNTFNFAVYRNLKRLSEKDNYDIVIDDLNKIPFYSPWLTKKPVMAILMHLFRGSIFKETIAPFAAYVYLTESIIPLAYKKCPVAVLSESTKKDVVRLGINPERITVVPPGTNFDRYKPDFSVKREAIILHVGRLKRYKSTDGLLQAARLLKDRGRRFNLVIVGTGDDRPRLEKLATELGIDKFCRFTGYISEDEKVAWYRRAALLVENSIKEGWGLIVMEANACATPVVVAKSPGLVDSSHDGVNGLFYEYGDIEDMSEKIDRLLEDDELRSRLGKQAVEWAHKWTWDGAAEKMEQIIMQAAREHNEKTHPS
ncbi:hypothetical protein CH330_00110 [candidate division WOR-3 bacterium JGI_Cruoil_03_51_56]|uniref:Glycosyl transferase family 1 n=1 Tax=candidate division WOR-3 bacterium JGI_Cruoil_03_51_56 TaxID=1973747 RepID=A0A235C0W1_UNCW3|nr:MAG: hypothetical protein CH330_00110 [candidate division WOR-3 bacterium JGI_Cruoil_03_51_56]